MQFIAICFAAVCGVGPVTAVDWSLGKCATRTNDCIVIGFGYLAYNLFEI